MSDEFRYTSSMSTAAPMVETADTARGAKADATRTAILETAERLFRTMGYQKTTVADIARELRMSPANVYRFFPSKAAINEAIAARLLGGLSEHLWSIARGPGSPPERLRTLFRSLHQQMMTLFFREKRMHDMVTAAMQENWSTIDAFVHEIDTSLRHIILDGQAAGVFARDLDPHATAGLVHATMLGFCHPTLIEQCMDDNLPALADGMAEFCLRALRP